MIYNRTDPHAILGAIKGLRPGDVAVIMPDDHPWGREELNTDKFYILSVPNLTVPEAMEDEVPRTHPDIDGNHASERGLHKRRLQL